MLRRVMDCGHVFVCVRLSDEVMLRCIDQLGGGAVQCGTVRHGTVQAIVEDCETWDESEGRKEAAKQRCNDAAM